MRLYLAGPMTGLPEWNYPAFADAARALRSQGHDVVNPAELDAHDDVALGDRPWAEYLKRDMAHLVTCEAVAVLPGWEESKGASLEVHVARALDVPVLHAEDLSPVRPQAANTEKAGGTRYSSGKPPLVGVPVLGLFEVGRISEMGAAKYALFDWHLGQSFSSLINCAARHLLRAVNDPLAMDPESGRLHLGHAAWNLLCALHFIEEGRAEEMDDITPCHGVSAAEKRRQERGAS